MSGCSALTRHSIAAPEMRTSSCLIVSGEPAAMLDLLVDEIDAGDHLGDGMLDLDAGVHLDEVELAVLVEELDGADADIAEFAPSPWRRRRRSARAARR